MAASILAADDSASMRQMVSFTLKSPGYGVVEGSDGARALDLAKDRPVNLVITDVNMPNMDGIALIRELRTLSSYRFTPFAHAHHGIQPRKETVRQGGRSHRLDRQTVQSRTAAQHRPESPQLTPHRIGHSGRRE